MASSAVVHVKENISLTEKEKKIFNRLLDVLRHFKLETQLRVAGGWVRDKLLGKECYDIDIALDNMLGREFCEKINEYLAYAGEEQQGVGVIQCNPDQSKHLETARMRIYDTWIDFVNLRSETYAENSRIPTMKFGTAEEDAYRRDLTINSMFYNINTDTVEDLTGRGLSDLRFGLIVTPLPPKATFLDDPLRVLRAIRFGARFGFLLDEELKKAAADEEVKSAIAEKISRERIGHEIDLMISGNHPVTAIKYICELQLFWVVFTLPNKPEPAVTEECNRLSTHMDTAKDILQLIGCSIFSEEQRRLYLYAALFLPLRKSVYADNKGKKIPVTTFFFRNSLKLKASDAETVASLHRAAETFVTLIPLIESNDGSEIADANLEEENLFVPLHSKRRVCAGLLLRQIKDFWRVALMLSSLLHDSGENIEKFPSRTSQLEQMRELFRRIENSIIELDLENIWEIKPLLDGKAIMNVLQLKTGGPLVREWQQRVLKWQLAHPSGTAEDCLDWIRESNAKRAKLL
ncbi:tRNA nucleotidyltransferase cca2-like isoform X1 [Aristolochia californica]|uniref:tRNA nucleotidyltransferase cca2-like isoform X1 n=1 Tax=Aristolochia californica TaxID=171875 RepID=UPI0035D56CAF